jgi:hypothetical protein
MTGASCKGSEHRMVPRKPAPHPRDPKATANSKFFDVAQVPGLEQLPLRIAGYKTSQDLLSDCAGWRMMLGPYPTRAQVIREPDRPRYGANE